MSNSQPKYQAIVFDLDGTAIPNHPDGMPSERLKSTIAKYRTRFHFIAATGRPLEFAAPVIKDLGLTDLCVISGGPIIYDPSQSKIIRHIILQPTTVKSILNALRQSPYRIYMREEVFMAANPPATVDDVELIVVEGVDSSNVPSLLAALESIQDISVSPVPAWVGTSLQTLVITHALATKANAVAEVLNILEIDPALAIGIGDGNNDLHLFTSVGLKIAMGNASPALKAAADVVAPRQDEDGLAEIIERYAD